MIKIENLSYRYKGEEEAVLKEINLEIHPKEIVAVVGKNGSGKSTLGRILSGIYSFKQGSITIDEFDIKKKEEKKKIRDLIGIVFQNPDNQILFSRVEDEFEFLLQNKKEEERKKIMKEVLAKVGMEQFQKESLATLSLGQKQRIVLATVLCAKTPYLVLDEPTTMLDSEGKEAIYEIIKKLKEEGYGILYITNSSEELLLADRIVILENGMIVKEIPKERLVNESQELVKHHIQVPWMVQLSKKLQEKKICNVPIEFTVDALAKAIIEGRKDEICL